MLHVIQSLRLSQSGMIQFHLEIQDSKRMNQFDHATQNLRADWFDSRDFEIWFKIYIYAKINISVLGIKLDFDYTWWQTSPNRPKLICIVLIVNKEYCICQRYDYSLQPSPRLLNLNKKYSAKYQLAKPWWFSDFNKYDLLWWWPCLPEDLKIECKSNKCQRPCLNEWKKGMFSDCETKRKEKDVKELNESSYVVQQMNTCRKRKV